MYPDQIFLESVRFTLMTSQFKARFSMTHYILVNYKMCTIVVGRHFYSKSTKIDTQNAKYKNIIQRC